MTLDNAAQGILIDGRSVAELNLLYDISERTIAVASDGYGLTLNGFPLWESQSYVPTPRRVIATTITPFDKFPLPRRQSLPTHPKVSSAPSYRYMGSKTQVGQSSVTAQLSRMLDSLMLASQKDGGERQRLSHIFEFLGYAPQIQADYHLRIDERALTNVFTDDDALISYLTRSASTSTRYKVLDDVQVTPAVLGQLRHALNRVLDDAKGRRSVRIALDFTTGLFHRGSLDLFYDIRLLREYGAIGLRDIRLIRTERPPHEVRIREASSGEQSVVLTLLGIASEIQDESLILIDEPEISLHPEWQERFFSLLSTTFANYFGCHFILATHSPLIVAQAREMPCAIVTMDDLTISNASDLATKSVDYQLAEVFETPGYRNEYLAREALAALRLVSERKYTSDEFRKRVELLRRIRPLLEDDDPVATMADAITAAAEAVNK